MSFCAVVFWGFVVLGHFKRPKKILMFPSALQVWGWSSVRWTLFSCSQPFATVLKNPSPMALPLGRSLKSGFMLFASKWYAAQGRWCISLHRRRVSWKWHVCRRSYIGFQSGPLEEFNRAATLGFAVARLLQKLRFCDKSQVKRRFWRRCVRVEMDKIIPNTQEKLQFWMSWGKWRKAFCVAAAAPCRLEGWQRWFRCTGAGFRESDTYTSQIH